MTIFLNPGQRTFLRCGIEHLYNRPFPSFSHLLLTHFQGSVIIIAISWTLMFIKVLENLYKKAIVWAEKSHAVLQKKKHTEDKAHILRF